MIKTIPTIPRLLAMVLFAVFSFGALLFLWMSFGGQVPLHAKGYRFNVMFPKAAQLAKEADVRISGVTVGKVVSLKAEKSNFTKATIELQPRYAPIPKAARATLRTKTLLGETYVELAPNRTKGTGPLPEDGSLAVDAVQPTVELDTLLKTFDPKTRAAFQTWMQSQAAALDGHGGDINAAFGQLPAFVDQFSDLAATLDSQDSAVRQAVSGTATVFDAISRSDDDLRNLMRDGDKTFSTIGQRNQKLAAIFKALPDFERQSSATLPEITKLGDRALPIIKRLQPAATELKPTFDALDRLSPSLKKFMVQLGPVVTASQKGLPAFDDILDQLPPVLNDFVPFTRTVNPLLRTIGASKQEFTSFLGNVTAASQATQRLDGDGQVGGVHFLRVLASLSPDGLAFQKRPSGQSRRNAYAAPGSQRKLATGLDTLTSVGCANGDPIPPDETSIPGQADLLKAYVFRTTGRDSPRPACTPQGNYPGFTTIFPQLHADPPVGQKAGTR